MRPPRSVLGIRQGERPHGQAVQAPRFIADQADQSFSDFPLLIPPASKAVKFLSITHELSIQFLRGNLGRSEILKDVQADAGKVERDDKGKMAFKGDVALHLHGEA